MIKKLVGVRAGLDALVRRDNSALVGNRAAVVQPMESHYTN
jgi:hypothetical protein